MARHPRGVVPGPFQTLVSTTQSGALDQNVYSFGLAYDFDDQTILYAGVNRGRRNIPEQNLGPNFALIQQVDYSFGFQHALGKEWSFGAGMEFLPQQMVTYNNPNLPFGQAVVTHSGFTVDLQLSRRW